MIFLHNNGDMRFGDYSLQKILNSNIFTKHGSWLPSLTIWWISSGWTFTFPYSPIFYMRPILWVVQSPQEKCLSLFLSSLITGTETRFFRKKTVEVELILNSVKLPEAFGDYPTWERLSTLLKHLISFSTHNGDHGTEIRDCQFLR